MQNDEKNLEKKEFKFSESYERRKRELLEKKFGKATKAGEDDGAPGEVDGKKHEARRPGI